MRGDTYATPCGNTLFTPTQNTDTWQLGPHTNRRESVVVR